MSIEDVFESDIPPNVEDVVLFLHQLEVHCFVEDMPDVNIIAIVFVQIDFIFVVKPRHQIPDMHSVFSPKTD